MSFDMSFTSAIAAKHGAALSPGRRCRRGVDSSPFRIVRIRCA